MDGQQIDCGRENRPQIWGSGTGQDGSFTRTWDAAAGRTIDVGLLIDESGTPPQQSPFFTRLPLEVRFRIYSLAMPQHPRLWVRPASRHTFDGRLEHFPCRRPPEDTAWMAHGGRCCIPVNNNFFEHVRATGVQPHQDSLALMRSCRQVYVLSLSTPDPSANGPGTAKCVVSGPFVSMNRQP